MASVEYLQNGRYALLKKLGEGGKGVVYKARDTSLNRIVAIKMLKSEVASEDAYSRFMTEAHAVAKLNHPNIVSIYDIGKEDGKQFFVLEFVDGESLRDLVQTYPEGKCDVQIVLRIAMDVSSALQYAHSEKVLHRDIKPENVMITQDGTAKLMDFGLAKMIGQPGVTQEGVIVGTVAYVAPEVALGKGADSRSDLYSLGAVLYEALSGKPPFPGEDPIKIIFGHIHDHPVPLAKQNPKAPQPLVDCIMKLLEKEPERRYKSAEDLLKTLRNVSEEFLRETLMPAHRPSVIVPSPRPSALKEVQLIDRIEEMALLKETADRAVRGEGSVVFLHGEAGIGKTRLARELGAYARLRGMQVLYGRCPALFRMDGVPAYVLWNEVIKDYLHACTSEQLYKVIGYYPSEVCKLVPEVKQKLGTIQQSLPISPEHERDRLFEAVSQFITNISKEAPLLVVLDDLQWTDESSLLLLHYLARGIQKEALLLVGDYRDTDVDEKHPLSPVLAELNRERLFQSVQLKRLSFNEISEMIKQILEQDDVPKEFCDKVFEKTRGNPFFAEEVIKSLKEEGVIYREGNKWNIREVSEIEFPKTVKSVIKARIGRLDDECQNVLTIASFVGNDFTFEAICAATGFEEEKLLELMEKIHKTGLFKHRVICGEETCSFADIIVRDVVYEEVHPFRRKKLHGIVGQALEKVYAGKIDEHFGELALHLLESGDKDKALNYFLKAGEKAAKVYANSEATSYLQSALGLLEEKKEEFREKARVLERLGDIKKLVGEYDTCLKYWNDGLLALEQLDEKRDISRLHRKIANVLWEDTGDVEKARVHHDKALKILEAEPESIELASLYEDMAQMYSRTESMTKALDWADKALELAKKLNDHTAIASSYNSLGAFTLWTSGDWKKAVECHEKALKIALDNGLMETAVQTYLSLGSAIPLQEQERSVDCFEKGFELAKRVGTIRLISRLGNILGNLYCEMGITDKAVILAEQSVALDRRTGNMPSLSFSLSALGNVYLTLGEWDKSEQYFIEALNLSRKLNQYGRIAWNSTNLSQLYGMEKGDFPKARELLEGVIGTLEKAGDKLSQMLVSSNLALVYIELGMLQEANALLDAAHKFFLEMNEEGFIAWVETLIGIELRAQKKWEESIGQFEKARQMFERINARRWFPYSFAVLFLCGYARVYLERDQAGDREKAHNLLNQALEIFQKVGAKKDVERILAKKKLLTA